MFRLGRRVLRLKPLALNQEKTIHGYLDLAVVYQSSGHIFQLGGPPKPYHDLPCISTLHQVFAASMRLPPDEADPNFCRRKSIEHGGTEDL